jgi:hypothetical protein
VALLTIATLPGVASAAVEDLPGMDTAANMKEWLKLTDDQVTKLKPVIARRLQRMDSALAKAEAEEKPDVMGLVEDLGKARKEFDDGVKFVLTPDQSKQWQTFKDELEKDLVKSAAKKQVLALQPGLISDGTRISMRDKLHAKRTIEAINEERQKSMATIVSPAQPSAYQQAMAKR